MLPVKKEIVKIIRRLPEDKLYLARDFLNKLIKIEDEQLTAEELAAIKKGEAQIARGEYVDFEEFCQRERL